MEIACVVSQNNQRQQMHISILTTTCEQFVEELELSGDQHSIHRENVSNLLLVAECLITESNSSL